MERKHSRKRDAILECLRGTKSHPTAEQIYQELKPGIPDLSLGTVYRNLAMFKKEGLIRSVGVHDGLEHFDGDISPHGHFVCTRCGAVLDLPGQKQLRELAAEAERLGCQVSGGNICLEGICSSCRNSRQHLM